MLNHVFRRLVLSSALDEFHTGYGDFVNRQYDIHTSQFQAESGMPHTTLELSS